jgi:hypothetical protein
MFNDVCVENHDAPAGARAIQVSEIPATPKYVLSRMSSPMANYLAEDGRLRFLELAEEKIVLVVPSQRSDAMLGCTVLWEGPKSELDSYSLPADSRSSVIKILGGKWMAMRATPLALSPPVPTPPR